jgi:hypothetical protein
LSCIAAAGLAFFDCTGNPEHQSIHTPFFIMRILTQANKNANYRIIIEGKWVLWYGLGANA